MDGVKQYGEVEAIRYMRMVKGEIETRDNDDSIRRLPTNMTKPGCYWEYGKSNHFKLARETDSGFKAVWIHPDLPQPVKGGPRQHYEQIQVGTFPFGRSIIII